jgi:hypothetical protein
VSWLVVTGAGPAEEAVEWAYQDGEAEACLRVCNQRERRDSRGALGRTSGASRRAAGVAPG